MGGGATHRAFGGEDKLPLDLEVLDIREEQPGPGVPEVAGGGEHGQAPVRVLPAHKQAVGRVHLGVAPA